MLLKLIGILSVAVVAFAQPQTTPAETLKFEVASVKPSGPQSVRGSEGGPGSHDPTHYRFQSANLDDLITTAYHVNYFQISSKTAFDRERFDVAVNVPEGATRDQFRQMMRNLLDERFHLRAHIESREFAAYELVVAKSGLKMKEHDAISTTSRSDTRRPSGDYGFPDLPPGRPGMTSRQAKSGGFLLIRVRAQEEPMRVLAEMLHVPGEEPIVDKTALSGKYDFTLEYTQDMPGSPHDGETPVVASIFTALPAQLGLQLIAKKLPFDVVVVESVEKTPTEN